MKLYVIFSLAGAEYALPADLVLQLETYTGATLVPGAPAFVAGIVTVRGRVVPVIDLALRFGLKPSEPSFDSRIIVTELAGRVVALRVDSAREVLKLDAAKHQAAPSLINERALGLVHGVHVLGTRLLQLVDLPKILGENSHVQSIALPDHGPRPALQLPR